MDNAKLSLDTLQGGAARELFDIELQKVLKNIADPNTKAEAKRTLILKVDITPSNRRERLGIDVEVSSKLSKMQPNSSMAFLEEDGDGGFVATEMLANQVPGQVRLDEDQKTSTPQDPKPERVTSANVRHIAAAGK